MAFEGPSLEPQGFIAPEKEPIRTRKKLSRFQRQQKSKKIISPMDVVSPAEATPSLEQKKVGVKREAPDEEDVERVGSEVLGIPMDEDKKASPDIAPGGKAPSMHRKSVEQEREQSESRKRQCRQEETDLLSEQLRKISLEGSLPEIPKSQEQRPVPMDIDFLSDITMDDLTEIADPSDVIDQMIIDTDSGTPLTSALDVLMESVQEEVPEVEMEPVQEETLGASGEAPAPVFTLEPPLPLSPPRQNTSADRHEEQEGPSSPIAPQMPILQRVMKRPEDDIEELMAGRHYAKAYQLLISLIRQKPGDTKLLLQTATCLDKMHRFGESLLIYRDLGKRDPHNTIIKEKIADCFFGIGDVIRAQIIYKMLQKLHPSRGRQLDAKIQQCKTRLTTSYEWDSFEQIFSSIGASGGDLTQEQMDAIDRINRQLIQKNKVLWDLFFLQTRKISTKYLKRHFSPVTLQCSDGRTFTAYSNPNFRFLAHFSSLQNAEKILQTEQMARLDPTIREQVDYFWNSQYKICASLLKFGSPTFFRGQGLGFVIDVPDPDRNILHAFVRDAWTPTFLRTAAAATVTGSGSEQKAREYNEFMERYKVISQYVYSLWQHATAEAQFLHLVRRISDLNTALSPNPIFRWLSTGVQYLRTLIGRPDENRLAIKNLMIKLKEMCSSQAFDPHIEPLITEVMEDIEKFLSKTGSASERTHIREEREAAERGFEARVRLSPEILTSPAAFQTSRSRLLDYLDKTIDMVRPLIAENPGIEAELFEKIFFRKPHPGEQLLQQLAKIRSQLERYIQTSVPKVYRSPQKADQAIFCRQLSPTEVFAGTQPGTYSEIGVRSHFSSHQIHARGAGFKAVVVEQSAIHGQHISPELANVLEEAQKASLPIICI